MRNKLATLLLAASLAAFVSCSNNDDGPETTFVQLIITEAGLPASFQLGELYEIPVTYQLEDGCTEFYTLSVNPTASEREIVAIGARTESGPCTQEIREGTEILIFQVLYDQTYLFRFWQGDDANGDPIYMEVEVPVE